MTAFLFFVAGYYLMELAIAGLAYLYWRDKE